MSDPNLQDFIDLSAELTGLSAKLLAPAVDPINLPPVFFDTAKQGMGTEAFSKLLNLYVPIKDQTMSRSPAPYSAVRTRRSPKAPARS